MHQLQKSLHIPAGPFKNDEPGDNIQVARRHRPARAFNHEANYREISEYFERRLQRLPIVKTTSTPRGQLIDWVPVESQHRDGRHASPPPGPVPLGTLHESERGEVWGRAELEHPGVERGPAGTVPILRKKLDALGYTRPLKEYLSKTRGHRIAQLGRRAFPVPEEGGSHRYGYSGQSVTCFGAEGQFSCFDPYTESSDDFSLIQLGLSNSDLGFKQTVEAGWQECQDITGDWVPHLFVYYTTNGYTGDDDNKGGYNTDVDGWKQHDDVIFPGSTFTPYSTRGGAQFKVSIKYQLWENNWWLACQGRWAGYYPASLFFGNQSIFSTLGDHADHIGFWGEVFDSDDVSGRTTTDMGSGYFAESGWTWAAYMHNLLVQTRREGVMSSYDGSAEIYTPDPDMYDIEGHFNSGSDWGSYAFVGGPGAG